MWFFDFYRNPKTAPKTVHTDTFYYFLFIDNHFSSLYDPIGFINRYLTPGLCSLGIFNILNNSSCLVSIFGFIY